MNIKAISKWERLLSFVIGILAFFHFELEVGQFIWGLFFITAFNSVVVATQCAVASGLIIKGAISRSLIPYWSNLRTAVSGLWSTLWILILALIAITLSLIMFLALIATLFPPNSVFSTPSSATNLFSTVNFIFFKKEIVPLWGIIIASTILIDWRLLFAPLLTVNQALQDIDQGAKEKTPARSFKPNGTRMAHQRLFSNIWEILSFYMIELSILGTKVLFICIICLVNKGVGLPDIVIILISYTVLCFNFKLAKHKHPEDSLNGLLINNDNIVIDSRSAISPIIVFVLIAPILSAKIFFDSGDSAFLVIVALVIISIVWLTGSGVKTQIDFLSKTISIRKSSFFIKSNHLFSFNEINFFKIKDQLYRTDEGTPRHWIILFIRPFNDDQIEIYSINKYSRRHFGRFKNRLESSGLRVLVESYRRRDHNLYPCAKEDD